MEGRMLLTGACAGVLILVTLIVVIVMCTVSTPVDIEESRFAEAEANAVSPDRPLHAKFKMRHGLPIVELYVNGDGPLKCVVDTGSSMLNVSSKDCEVCDMRMGAVRIEDEFDSDSEDDDNGGGVRLSKSPSAVTHIRYGSQQDTVKKVVGTLEVGSTEVRNMPMYVTTKRNVTSKSRVNFNVLGLLSKARGGRVLHHIMPAGHMFIIEYWARHGLIFSLPSNQTQDFPVQVPWRRPPGATFRYYTVPVNELTATRDYRTSTSIAGHADLRHMVVDTGSNMTSVPPAVFRKLLPHLQRNETIEFHFPGKQSLLIPFQNYRWRGRPDGELMINDDIAAVRSAPGSMLLSSYALRHYTLGFSPTHLLIRPSSQPLLSDEPSPL
jgi:hypothetical protein